MPGQANPIQALTQPSEERIVAIHSFDVSRSALEAFGPEVSPTRSPTIAVSGGQSRISLADLKAAGILFDQNDAVALGQSLCRAFIGSQLRRRMNPRLSAAHVSAPMTLESILIDSAGRVKASVGDLDDEAAAVNNIGQVLSRILPDDGRSFLRTKIISKALASPPQFKTVDELSQALRAMERPDGREVIRAVYELWERESQPVAPLVSIQEWPPRVVDPPPIPVPSETDHAAETPETGPVPVSKRRRLFLVAAIVGGGVAGSVIGAFVLLSSFRGGPAASSAAAAPTNAGARAPSALQATDTKRNNVTFTGPLPPVRQSIPPSSTPSAVRSAVSDAASSGAAHADLPAPMIATASDVNWRLVDPQENRRARPTNVPASGTPSPPHAAEGSNQLDYPARADVDTNRVYSAKDPDVVPPTPILPRLLAGLHPSTPGIRPSALTVAVIVAPDGTVESVRGLVAPQSMGETVMLTEALSAVKSWRFSPATKDGEPVKYEQVVPLATVMRARP